MLHSPYTFLLALSKPLLAGGLLRLGLVIFAGAWIEPDHIDVFHHLAQTEVLFALLPHLVLSGDQSTFYIREIATRHPRLLSIIHEAEVPIFNPIPPSANDSANSLVPEIEFLRDLDSNFNIFDLFSSSFLWTLSDLSYELHPNATELGENAMSFLLNDPDSPDKWTSSKDFDGNAGDSQHLSDTTLLFLSMEDLFQDFYKTLCPPIHNRLAYVHDLQEKQHKELHPGDSDAPRLLCLKKQTGDAQHEGTWTPPFGCHERASAYSEEQQDTAFVFETDE